MCIRDRSKSDTVGNSDDDESINLVEVIEGVVVGIHELESGWRANFSRGVGGEEMASRVYLEDIWSTNNSLGCYNIPGRARWYCNKVVLTSAWSESVKWVWESDYRE